MKHIHKLTLFVLLALSMTACIKEGYDSENCPGELKIIPFEPNPDGSGTGMGDELKHPETTLILPDGSTVTIQAGSDQSLDLEEGTYTVVSTQGDDMGNLTLTGTEVSVAVNPDGTLADVGELVGGYTDIQVGGQTENENTVFKIPTHFQTRELIVKVKFTGRNVQMLEGVDGTVDGIAASRDLNNGFPPVDGEPRHPVTRSGKVAYSFDRTAPETRATAEQDFRSETRRLLGIDGDAEQQLTLNAAFGGEVLKEYRFNIARDMDNFHILDVTRPWVIEVTLHLGADFSATIEDWKSGPESWMDAEH